MIQHADRLKSFCETGHSIILLLITANVVVARQVDVEYESFASIGDSRQQAGQVSACYGQFPVNQPPCVPYVPDELLILSQDLTIERIRTCAYTSGHLHVYSGPDDLTGQCQTCPFEPIIGEVYTCLKFNDYDDSVFDVICHNCSPDNPNNHLVTPNETILAGLGGEPLITVDVADLCLSSGISPTEPAVTIERTWVWWGGECLCCGFSDVSIYDVTVDEFAFILYPDPLNVDEQFACLVNCCNDDDACNGIETGIPPDCIHGEEVECDDMNACTSEQCVEGSCVFTELCNKHTEVCCGGQCCLVEDCCDDVCQMPGCFVSLDDIAGFPCETVELELVADCWPDCGSMTVQLIPQYPVFSNIVPWLDLGSPEIIECMGGPQFQRIDAYIEEFAPAGRVMIKVVGQTNTGARCESESFISVKNAFPIIEVRYKSFIAPAVVETVPSPFLYDYHQGDNRWFQYAGGSSRSFQATRVSIDPKFATGQVGTPLNLFGTTRAYSGGDDVISCAHCANDYGDWCLAPGAMVDCRNTAVPGQGGNVLEILHSRTSPREVQVRLNLEGYNACETGDTPAIDANLTVEFRRLCHGGSLGRMEFRLFGYHDGFPWHELYINGYQIYIHDPCLTGEGPNSLFGSGRHYFETTDVFHIPPFGVPLNIWQPVPGVEP